MTFSEAMNAGATPTLVFGSSVAGSLAFASGVWSNGNTVYTATYDVADANVNLSNITIDVTGAQDAAGNAQTDYTPVAEFGIATGNAAPSDLVFTGNIGLAATTNGMGGGADDTEIAAASLFTVSTVDPDDASGFEYTFSGSATFGVTVDNGGAETFTMNAGTGVVTTSSLDYDNGVQNITITTPRSADPDNATKVETVTLILGTNNNGDSISGSLTTNDQVIYGFGGSDTISGGSGKDWIAGGTGADTMTGGGGADVFAIAAGHSTPVVVTSGGGSVFGFDIITDFDPAVDKIEFSVTPVAATGGNVNGTDSTLAIGGDTIESHSVTDGVATFFGTDGFANPLTIGTNANLAAVVQYLMATDIGAAGATLAFRGMGNTFIYQQGGSNGGNGTNTLVQLSGVDSTDLPNLNALINTTVDPIVLDLDHNGVAFSSLEDGVSFDINGDRAQDQIAWTANGGDGILALDVDGSGKVENGNELFTPTFNGGNFADGIAALASLDGNHDGVIDSQDAAFGDLVVWQDANHDGVSDNGELAKLGDLGISSIDLATTPGAPIDGQNVPAVGSFTYADGTTGTFVEVDLDASLGTLPADIVVEFDDGGGDLDLSVLDTVAAGVAPPQQTQGGEASAPVADAGSTVPAAITIMHEQAALAMQLAAS
ncbi:beta strand repeat-containing protein [Bradyrhizobium sp. TZ2]